MRTGLLSPIQEARNLLPKIAARPGDIYVENWTHGRAAAMDITVTSPLTQTRIELAAVTPGHAAEMAAVAKERKAALR